MNLFITLFSLFVSLLFLFRPFFDHEDFLFSRSNRIRLIHKIFTIRNACFTYFQISSKTNLSSESRALKEILQLHQSPFDRRSKPNINQLKKFRQTAEHLLSALFPPVSSTCHAERIHFRNDDDSQVKAFFISHHQSNSNWTSTDRRLILYLHGGAFVFGDMSMYFGYQCYLAEAYRMGVIFIEYRRSPEYSIQSSFEDVQNAYRSMLKIDPIIHRRLIGMADSSGSLLWFRLIKNLLNENLPRPSALVLHSPWFNLNFFEMEFEQSFRPFYTWDILFTIREEIFPRHAFIFVPSTSKSLRHFNPIDYSFEGFPPIYVTVGTDDVFIHDARLLKDQMIKSNVRIHLDEGQDLMHIYSMFHLWSPEARCSQKRILNFLRSFFN